MKNLILMCVVIIMMTSCASTEIVKSWSDPGTSITPNASNKTFVIAMVKDEASRRVVEDNLVKRFKGNAVASYTILSTEALKNGSEEVLNQKINEGKYSHVLMMSLADIEKETSYVQGTTTGYYGGYGRYYGYGAGMYSTPGYYTTDKNYYVEITVYSVSPNKLLWTGTTKTVNPSKIDQTVNEIADAVVNKMKKEGFLK
jgi:hypothetical protein